MSKRRFPIVLIIGALILSACASATATPDAMVDKSGGLVVEENGNATENPATSPTMEKPSQGMEDPTPDEMIEDEKEVMEDTPEPMESSDANEKTLPDWFSASLTDVNTGQSFSIKDFEGKVILVETLAMWCSTCRKQQIQVLALHDVLGDRDDFVSIALDIDPNEISDDLIKYTQNNGFNWVYAISPPRVSSEIAELYGNQFLNPPSAPMFIIDRSGEVHLLRFGVKSAEELSEALQPLFDEAM